MFSGFSNTELPGLMVSLLITGAIARNLAGLPAGESVIMPVLLVLAVFLAVATLRMLVKILA